MNNIANVSEQLTLSSNVTFDGVVFSVFTENGIAFTVVNVFIVFLFIFVGVFGYVKNRINSRYMSVKRMRSRYQGMVSRKLEVDEYLSSTDFSSFLTFRDDYIRQTSKFSFLIPRNAPFNPMKGKLFFEDTIRDKTQKQRMKKKIVSSVLLSVKLCSSSCSSSKNANIHIDGRDDSSGSGSGSGSGGGFDTVTQYELGAQLPIPSSNMRKVYRLSFYDCDTSERFEIDNKGNGWMFHCSESESSESIKFWTVRVGVGVGVGVGVRCKEC